VSAMILTGVIGGYALLYGKRWAKPYMLILFIAVLVDLLYFYTLGYNFTNVWFTIGFISAIVGVLLSYPEKQDVKKRAIPKKAKKTTKKALAKKTTRKTATKKNLRKKPKSRKQKSPDNNRQNPLTKYFIFIHPNFDSWLLI
jgi:hypothetical protein